MIHSNTVRTRGAWRARASRRVNPPPIGLRDSGSSCHREPSPRVRFSLPSGTLRPEAPKRALSAIVADWRMSVPDYRPSRPGWILALPGAFVRESREPMAIRPVARPQSALLARKPEGAEHTGIRPASPWAIVERFGGLSVRLTAGVTGTFREGRNIRTMRNLVLAAVKRAIAVLAGVTKRALVTRPRPP